jgi:predicted tellurium resistance membrane protein TerC
VVGLTLLLEGLDVHVPKGYIYFAMLFSLSVEALNIRMRKRSDPLKLHKKYD